jgi:hypothetical protein
MYNERQPAQLAIINMRKALDAMEKQPKEKPQVMSGLLAPKKTPSAEMTQTKSESRRVLEYMREIRNIMKDNTNVV